MSNHRQNGVAKRKTLTIVSLSRAMLFTEMTKNPTFANIGLWSFSSYHTADVMNNTPTSSGLSPKETLTRVKGDRYLKNICFWLAHFRTGHDHL